MAVLLTIISFIASRVERSSARSIIAPRVVSYTERLFNIDNLAPFDLQDGIVFPADWKPVTKKRYQQMVSIANELAEPFQFVRIDLLNGSAGVYFGEFTLTPDAAIGIAPSSEGTSIASRSHKLYSGHILAHLKANGAIQEGV